MTPPLSEHGQLAAVLMKHPRDAFVNDAVIAAQWRELNFSAPPDLPRAIDEYERFLEIIAGNGCEIVFLPESDATTLDSIYTRDATVESPLGMILASMGKRSRTSEPHAQAEELGRGGWPLGGAVAPPGHLEGGDLIWLDQKTVAVGHGARTNLEGIRQLKTPVERLNRRAHRRAAAGRSRSARCHALDVARQPGRPRLGRRLLALAA